jgi:hypothetical protein
VIRLLRRTPLATVSLAGLSLGCGLALTACGTGTTEAPRAASTPTPAPAATPSGFPGDLDGPVLDAARKFATTVATYDHTKLADQRNAVLPLTAPPLRDALATSLADGGDFATDAANESRDASANVLDVGMISREGNRAVVLLFVDQKVTSPSTTETERLRERITLTQDAKGAWLATKLETL